MQNIDLTMILTMALHGSKVHIVHSGYTVATYDLVSRDFEMSILSAHIKGDLDVAQHLVKARPEYYENRCLAFLATARHVDKVTLNLAEEKGEVLIHQGPVLVATWKEGRIRHAGNASPHADAMMRYHCRDLHEACQSVHNAAQQDKDKEAIRRLLFSQRGSATAQRLLDFLGADPE